MLYYAIKHPQQDYPQRRSSVKNVVLFNFTKSIGKQMYGMLTDAFGSIFSYWEKSRFPLCNSDVFSIAENHTDAIKCIWSELMKVYFFKRSYDYKDFAILHMLFLWSRKNFLNCLDRKLMVHFRTVATIICKKYCKNCTS